MADRDADYYVLPSAWCDACTRQVTCQVLAWDVADERVATFVCPGCGRPLGVGLHGQMSWTPRDPARRHAAARREQPSGS